MPCLFGRLPRVLGGLPQRLALVSDSLQPLTILLAEHSGVLGQNPKLFRFPPRRFRQHAVFFGTVPLLIRLLTKMFSTFAPLLRIHTIGLRPGPFVWHSASLRPGARAVSHSAEAASIGSDPIAFDVSITCPFACVSSLAEHGQPLGTELSAVRVSGKSGVERGDTPAPSVLEALIGVMGDRCHR